MSRYIDIDKVLMALRLDHKDVIYIDKNDTAKRIEKIQGIDLVRCKECKYYTKRKFTDGSGEIWEEDVCDHYNLTAPLPDDFCSYGERKDKEITTDCSWR